MRDAKDKNVIIEEIKSDQTAEETGEKEVAVGDKTEIAIINERTIREKIYIVRGVKVMLDF